MTKFSRYARKCKCDVLSYWKKKFPIVVHILQPNYMGYAWNDYWREWPRKVTGKRKEGTQANANKKNVRMVILVTEKAFFVSFLFCFIFKVRECLKKKRWDAL